MSANSINNQSYLKTVNLGYKYRLYPTIEQQKILNHQMFVYNQAYNICLNLWKKESIKNKDLDKKDKIYRKAVSYDRVVKRALRLRKVKFSTVVTQQSRINFLKAVRKAFSKDTVSKRLKAIEKAITGKEKTKAYNLGFPTFKSSKDPYQSFNWNNQGYQINDNTNNNHKFKILRLLKTDLKIRYHRKLPENYKLCSINISKDTMGYYVSFGIEFKKLIVSQINDKNFDIDNSIGIDLNTYNIAVSKPINKLMKNISNKKNDLYHKISTTLTNKFDMIVVEDLKTKNMSKSSKGNEINHGKMVKQKSGLNRTILSASFYQFVAMLQYKHSMLNDKLLLKVNPAYTSQECSKCGCRDKNNRPKQHIFKCISCGYKVNPDVQASSNILNKGLQSIGVGITLEDSNIKAFRSETLVSAS